MAACPAVPARHSSQWHRYCENTADSTEGCGGCSCGKTLVGLCSIAGTPTISEIPSGVILLGWTHTLRKSQALLRSFACAHILLQRDVDEIFVHSCWLMHIVAATVAAERSLTTAAEAHPMQCLHIHMDDTREFQVVYRREVRRYVPCGTMLRD